VTPSPDDGFTAKRIKPANQRGQVGCVAVVAFPNGVCLRVLFGQADSLRD